MSDVQKMAKRYLIEHPEIGDLLNLFKVVQQEYESYLATVTLHYEPPNSNTVSIEGQYNADVSGTAR